MYRLREELRIMRLRLLTLVLVTVGVAVAAVVPSTSRADDASTPDYTPDPASLSKHTAPKWFEDAKLGFFIHWGPYSVPAYAPPSGGSSYAEWYWNELNRPGSPTWERHRRLYGEDFPYDRFIEQWKAEKFNPDAWLRLFKRGGAKYFVQVSKHHDGVALFDTATTGRSTVELGPHRDFVKELFDAANRGHYGLKRGVYYSLPEWFNPSNAFGGTFGQGPPRNPFTGEPTPYTGYKPIDSYVDDHQYPQMLELIDQYDPDILWCDIGGDNRSNEVFAHYFNQAKNRPRPKAVTVDDRCGNGIYDFTTPEYSVEPDINPHKWEATRGIGRSFGYNAEEGPSDYLSSNELVDSFTDIVSKNGNLLLNLGPKADGTIPEIQAERVRALGAWLRVNGAAIYGTTYWTHAEDEAANVPVRYTARGGKLYATALEWPGERLTLSGDLPLKANSRITLLGNSGKPLAWRRDGGTVDVRMPRRAHVEQAYTFTIATPGLKQLVRTRLEIPQAADRGKPFTATVTATNIGASRSPAGDVTIDAPTGWTIAPASVAAGRLAPRETRTFEFQVTAPADATPGHYTLTARSTFGAMTYQARSGSARVGFRNAAEGKAATQKSLAWGGTPDRAVDGNVDGTFFHDSVTHTAEDGSAEPWWQVDLGTDVPIGELAVWNRTDCCADRLSDYYVFVSDHPFTSDSLAATRAEPGVTAFHEQGTAGRPTTFPADVTGRYVRVQLAGNAPLSLAEVEVLAVGDG
jgi:alpha-L-fucosidase